MVNQYPSYFAPADAQFGQLLERKYLRPSIIWMVRQKGTEILDAIPLTSVEQDSCWWAMALYIEALLNSLELEGFKLSEKMVLGNQAVKFAQILIENQSGNGAWDDPKGIWDTSAVCRAFVILLNSTEKHSYLSISEQLKENVIKSIKMGTRWLVTQVMNWDSLKYPYGPEDLATVLRFFAVQLKTGLQVYESSILAGEQSNSFVVPKSEKAFISLVVQKLLLLKTCEAQGSNLPPVIYWESPFLTAQIMRGFVEVLDYLSTDIKAACIESLLGAILYVENMQDEGRWGLPNTTSVVLEAYVATCHKMTKLLPNGVPHIEPVDSVVFKGLRWLVEQRAPDGSIAHAYWHTVFFVLMIQFILLDDVHFTNFTVLELYDYIIWESQTNISKQRAVNLMISKKLIDQERIIKGYIRFYNTAVTTGRVTIVVVTFLAVYFVAIKFGWLDVRWIGFIPETIDFQEPEVVVTLFIAWVSPIVAFWRISRKWLRTFEE